MSTKAKAAVILCLVDTAMAKTHRMVVNGSNTSKELWNKLLCIVAVHSARVVTNLQTKLKPITFQEELE